MTLQNEDIELPDIMTYNNKTNFLVSGRVLDQDGVGVENAWVTVTCYEPRIWVKKVFTDVVYSDNSYDLYDRWYASGVGLVKSIKVIVSDKVTFERVMDELKTYQLR